MGDGSSLNTLIEDSTCPKCNNVERNPVTLGCQHVFCRECLRQEVFVRTLYHKDIKCPFCKTKHHLLASGMHGFDQSFPVKGPIMDSNHSIYGKCEQHPSEDLDFFCHYCKYIICKKCMEYFHKEHSVENEAKASMARKQVLQNDNTFIQTNEDNPKKAKLCLQSKQRRILHFKHLAEQNVEEQATRMKQEVERAVSKMKEDIQNRFRAYEQEIEQDFLLLNEKEKNIAEYKTFLNEIQGQNQPHDDTFENYKNVKGRTAAVLKEQFASFRKSLDEKLHDGFHLGKINIDQLTSMLGTVPYITDEKRSLKEIIWSENDIDFSGVSEIQDSFQNYPDRCKPRNIASKTEEMLDRRYI